MTNKQDLSLEIPAGCDKICIIRRMPKIILYVERNACAENGQTCGNNTKISIQLVQQVVNTQRQNPNLSPSCPQDDDQGPG